MSLLLEYKFSPHKKGMNFKRKSPSTNLDIFVMMHLHTIDLFG